jgi:hypothetical protein
MEEAATELRRLHEENERLKSAKAAELEACAKLCDEAAANYYPRNARGCERCEALRNRHSRPRWRYGMKLEVLLTISAAENLCKSLKRNGGGGRNRTGVDGFAVRPDKKVP